MPVFRITSRSLGTVDVEGINWLAALGEGLARLGCGDAMDRIACESLPNGQILVRDVRRGLGFVVQPLVTDPPEDTEEVDDVPVAGEADDDDLVPASLQDEVEEILRAPSAEAAVRQALDAAVARIPSEGGAILLRMPDETLKFAGTFGPASDTLANISLPAGTGVAGFCVDRASAVCVLDAPADPRFFPVVDRVTGIRTRSLLCVPIQWQRRVLGCLELINGDRETFRGDGMTDAQVLANALAQRLQAES